MEVNRNNFDLWDFLVLVCVALMLYLLFHIIRIFGDCCA